MRCSVYWRLSRVDRICMLEVPEVMHCVLLFLLDWEGVAIENDSGACDDAVHGRAGDWVVVAVAIAVGTIMML